jgi:hypothetical protein
MGLVGVPFLGLGIAVIPLLEANLSSGVDYDELRKQGKQTPGRFEGAEERMNVTINGRHPLIVSYSYTVDGAERTGSMDTMDHAKVGRWSVGDRVTVIYSGDQSMLADVEQEEFPFWVFYLTFCGMGGVFTLFLFYAIAGASRKAALYGRGLAAKGRVLSIRERVWGTYAAFFRFGYLKQYVCTYAFTGPTGSENVGKSAVRNIAWANSRKEGDEVDVLYLPEDESKSCVAEEEMVLRCRPEV